MFEELNIKLRAEKEKIILKKRLESDLFTLKYDLICKLDMLEILKRDLEKEYLDIKRLEGISLSGFVASILGYKEEMLKKEENEYLVAKIKYDEINQEIESLNKDIEAQEKRLENLSDCEINYKVLFKQKEEEIMLMGNEEIKEKLNILNKNINNKLTEVIEVKEAIVVGEQTLDTIHDVEKYLYNIETLDHEEKRSIGLFSIIIEQENIDDAQNKFNKLQYLINKFIKELRDINSNIDSYIEKIREFCSYGSFEVFYNNISNNTKIENKIKEFSNKIILLKNSVENTMKFLHDRKTREEVKIERLKKCHEEFIEKSI